MGYPVGLLGPIERPKEYVTAYLIGSFMGWDIPWDIPWDYWGPITRPMACRMRLTVSYVMARRMGISTHYPIMYPME